MIMASKKLISVVIPIFNEEECIDALHQRLSDVLDQIPNCVFEVILVENGSSDNSWEKLRNIHGQDSRFKILRLAKNATCDGGILAGLSVAKGDAAIILYADLQDPPELISDFIQKWEEGYKNVYGIIQKRKDNVIRSVTSKIFYWLLNRLTGRVIPKNVGDFRLVDKSLYKLVTHMPEQNIILRGVFAWSGMKSIGIPYKREKRYAGKSESNTLYALQFAFKAIFGFSYFPLTLIFGMGCVLSLSAFCVLVLLSIKFLFWGVPFDGFGTLIGVMLLLFGFVFMMMGVMSKYIAMIFEEVKGRPHFIVTEKSGFDE